MAQNGHGCVAHCRDPARFVITSLPSSPAATHAAQRQPGTGRCAVRIAWQTGQWCSYRARGGLRPCTPSRTSRRKPMRTRGSKPAVRISAAHSGPCGRTFGPCNSSAATWATSWQSTSSSSSGRPCSAQGFRRTTPRVGTQRPSERRMRRLKLTETRPSKPGRFHSVAHRATFLLDIAGSVSRRGTRVPITGRVGASASTGSAHLGSWPS